MQNREQEWSTLRKFTMGMGALLLSVALISSCAPLVSTTPTSQPTTAQTSTPSPVPTTTPTETLTPSPTVTKTATPTTTLIATSTATATETSISPDQLASELGWEPSEGPFMLQDLTVGKVLLGGRGVMGYLHESRGWIGTKRFWNDTVITTTDCVQRQTGGYAYGYIVFSGGIIEKYYPIYGEGRILLGESVISMRGFYFSLGDLRVVNIPLLVELPDGEIMVPFLSWDALTDASITPKVEKTSIIDYFQNKLEAPNIPFNYLIVGAGTPGR